MPPAAAAEPRQRPSSAEFAGTIDDAGVRQFLDAVAGNDVGRLVITSNGGHVEAAINLASWVFEHRVDVEVRDFCLSSCANYVFPAGRRKIIRDGAIVAWHGNYIEKTETGWRSEIAARMRRTGEDAQTAKVHARGMVERLAARERRFFEEIGVDQRLCWIGNTPPYAVPDHYFLSVPDMARFGVTNVEAPGDYPATDVSRFDVGIRYIVLDESFRERRPLRGRPSSD